MKERCHAARGSCDVEDLKQSAVPVDASTGRASSPGVGLDQPLPARNMR